MAGKIDWRNSIRPTAAALMGTMGQKGAENIFWKVLGKNHLPNFIRMLEIEFFVCVVTPVTRLTLNLGNPTDI